MTLQSTYQEETKLKGVLAEIDLQLSQIGPRYVGNDFTEQMLDLQREERKRKLGVSQREPYFGRIDFQEGASEAIKPLYIGKAGLEEHNSHQILVIDWRAPIASLFYSFSGGDAPVAYESPDGEIEGVIHLKRNLMVRQGELVRVVDSYVRGQDDGAVTDEFLLYRLGESKDNKLRDIVSTIQGEQDRIIRADKNKAIFIQGVAGSGKTTVALHRLAFLLYQYGDRIRSERMIIFAPNKMFLDYISGVLPELGVGDIHQTTFADWALDLLDHEVSLASQEEALAYWFEQGRSQEEIEQAPGRYKGSLAFVSIIDEALRKLESSLLPTQPFEPLEGMKLSIDTMSAWYAVDDGSEPLMRRRDRLASRLKRWLESELKSRRIVDKASRGKALAKLSAYVKKLPNFTAPQLYRSLFEGKEAVPQIPRPIVLAAAAGLKKGIVQTEDLAPLVYLHIRMNGLGRPAFDHIVIDEAQDYSPFQLEALRLCQRQPSMTVLGDLQQGIHAYAGVHSWGELMNSFDEGATSYFELDRSYRSTTEIIEFANRILAGMSQSVNAAVPVFRSGDPVEVASVQDAVWLPAIAETVDKWLAEGSVQTIAVIGRTAAECANIHAYLQERGYAASLVESKNPAYAGGVTVVPVYLSKGLEFDAVLIADAGSGSYGPLDAKLLYVGSTRALHKLKALYRGQLTELLG